MHVTKGCQPSVANAIYSHLVVAGRDGEDATQIRSVSRVQGPATRTSRPAAQCVSSIKADRRRPAPTVIGLLSEVW